MPPLIRHQSTLFFHRSLYCACECECETWKVGAKKNVVFYSLMVKRVLYYVWFTINNRKWLHVFHHRCHCRYYERRAHQLIRISKKIDLQKREKHRHHSLSIDNFLLSLVICWYSISTSIYGFMNFANKPMHITINRVYVNQYRPTWLFFS